MKVLVVDSLANSDTALIFDMCTRLVQDPEIQVRFAKYCEDAIDYAQWFQPEAILFTGKLRGAENKRLLDRLQSIVSDALMLYLEKNQLYVHVRTVLEPGMRHTALPDGASAAFLHDLANAAAVSVADNAYGRYR